MMRGIRGEESVELLIFVWGHFQEKKKKKSRLIMNGMIEYLI